MTKIFKIRQIYHYAILFQEDADFIDFPDIPKLVEIPMPDEEEGTPYGEYQLAPEVMARLDAFLLKREDWKRRWENLPEEKREAFEKYIDEKLKA